WPWPASISSTPQPVPSAPTRASRYPASPASGELRAPPCGTSGEWAEASSPRESGGALVAPHPSASAQTRLFQGQDLAPPAADRRGRDQELRLCIAPHRASQRRLSMAA